MSADLIKEIADLSSKISIDIEHKIQQNNSIMREEWKAMFVAQIGEEIARRLFIPNLQIADKISTDDFLQHSTCSAADMLHPRYAEISKMLHHPPVFHRKLWEWVYIVHKLIKSHVIGEGKRGLVFGVGRENLPALFASMGASIVATDAPPEIGIAAGWNISGEYANSLEQLRFSNMVSDKIFDEKVSHRYCDMTKIDDDLIDFDFTWSSCCFEHLGSLEAGIQFVVDSVKTLKVGGVACHTTEFNLSSDEQTLEMGGTVIYRRRDILDLIERLRALGHEVESFSLAPDSHYIDGYVDVPPYTHNPHLRLQLDQFVTTSVGIFVRKC